MGRGGRFGICIVALIVHFGFIPRSLLRFCDPKMNTKNPAALIGRFVFHTPQLAAVGFLILLFSCLTAAQEIFPEQGAPYAVASFTLRDVTAKANISELPVMFFAHNLNTREDERITQYVDASGTFSHRLTPGNWIIEFRVFDSSVNAFLYYSKNAINIQLTDRHLNKTFYLTPVGSVDGSVLGPEGAPVAGADLDFVCAANLRYDDLPSTTNALGAFHADILPVGMCKVYSTTEGLIGSADVKIEHGQRAGMTIRLAKKTTQKRVGGIWLFAALGVLLGGIALFIIQSRVKKEVGEQLSKISKRRSKGKEGGGRPSGTGVSPISPAGEEVPRGALHHPDKIPQVPADEQTSANLNPRARDILKTLNERESAIATFLLDSGHETTQAKIRNTLGIPKTSLVRLFRTLEEKRVLHVDCIGNLKKIKLTDWFLGKD